jgi:hypothetical protein
MTVGVSKKRVRVITQGVTSSVEQETDVYVVNTTDASLQLATSADVSSSTDLTGSVTIGSDSNAQVVLGSGPSADVFIGNNGTATTANIHADGIYLGSPDGSHSIYVGRPTAPASDSIFIGTGPLSTITLGSGVDGYNSQNYSALDVNSRTVNIGQTTGNISAHTALTLRGRNINTRATEDYNLKAQGDVVLVANDDSLNGSGVRTYLSLGDGAATLAHVNSSNTIQANCSLSSGTATVFGLTEAKLDSNASAVVESPNTVITGTTSILCSSPNTVIEGTTTLGCDSAAIGLVGSTEVIVTSPSSSIRHIVTTPNPSNFGNTPYSISGSNAFTSSIPSNYNKGTVTLKAAQVTTNGANTQINGYTLASQITMSPSSEGKNIHARSASGILLRSNDAQLNNVLNPNQSGYYAELNGKAELRAVDTEGSILSKVTVDGLKIDINSYGYIATLSGTSTSLTTTQGNITLEANSNNDTAGDINLNSRNDITLATGKGNITLDANSIDDNRGDIYLTAHNDITLTTENGRVTISANFTEDDSSNGDIFMYGGSDVKIRAATADTYDYGDNYRGTLLNLGHNSLELHMRDKQDNVAVSAGMLKDHQTYGNRFYSTSGFYSGNGGGTGPTAGYAPFTGVHMFDVQPDSNISIGDAVIAVNHTAMLTTTPNDKRVVGIVCEILENNRISVASVGDNECGQLKGFKVCNENGTISAGDLLTTSSTAGYLMKQSDDIMRSSTVGKSAVDVVFDNNNLAVDVYGFIYCG